MGTKRYVAVSHRIRTGSATLGVVGRCHRFAYLAFGVRQMKPTVERLLVIQWSSLTSYDLLAGCQKFRSLDQYVILTARQEKASVSGSDVRRCAPWV
jgi:hypothetical protein